MSFQKSNHKEQNENTADNSKIDDSYGEDDNLCFNSKLILDLEKYPKAKKNSVDSVHFKYSIDISTAPKNRLQTYLNSDLLDELENTNFEEKQENEEETNEQQKNENINDENNCDNCLTSIILNDNFKPYFPKKKKPFSIREGDWTCSMCRNLNFSFRIKCNRCGISKEMSIKKALEILNENNAFSSLDNNIIGNSYNNTTSSPNMQE